MIVKVYGSCQVNDPHGDEYHDPLACVECEIDGGEFARYCNVSSVIDSKAYFTERDGQLTVVVEYELSGYVSFKELERLQSYTQGQWSDGIGEVYEQRPQFVNHRDEVYVSMWYYDQDIYLEVN